MLNFSRRFVPYLLLLIFISCSFQPDPAARQSVPSKKIWGTRNTKDTAGPVITLLTDSNRPLITVAGRPVVNKNPNADGLGDPDFTHYGTEQGLVLGNTTTSLLDRWGNLWFASEGAGVSKYDGKKFTVYGAANGLDNGIYSMAQDSSGNFWFETGGDLYRYDGVRFMHDTSLTGLGSEFLISDITVDRKGNSWFSTNRGMIKYHPVSGSVPVIKKFTIVDGLINNGISEVYEDHTGRLWVGTRKGLSQFDGKVFKNYSSKDGLIKDKILYIGEDLSGNIWLATDSGVSKFDGVHFVNYTTREGLIDNSVKIVKKDILGNMWFGTDSGVSIFPVHPSLHGNNFINYSRINGLSDNHITTITEDPSGNMWIGTNSGGLCKFNRNSVSKFTTASGLKSSFVKSILQDKQNKLWFGTLGGGVSNYDGEYFTTYTRKQGLPGDSIYCIREDNSGNLWFGGDGEITKFDGKKFTVYGPKQGVPHSSVWNILKDSKGNLWFTSWQGILKFDGKSFFHYTSEQGLVSDLMLSAAEDTKGNIWFSAYGLSRFDGKYFTNYTTANGMPLSELPGLLADSKGNIWLGTYGNGASRLTDSLLTTFTTTQGLANNTVSKILEDTVHHNIWFATNSGLSVMKSAEDAGAGHDTILFQNFNNRTGYDIKDFVFNFSLFVDHQGIIWAGSGDGKLLRFDYDHLYRNDKPFRLQIENVSIGNENISWNVLLAKLHHGSSMDTLAIINEMANNFGKVLPEQETRQLIKRYSGLDFDSISPFYSIPQHLSLPYNLNNVSIEFAAIEPAFDNQIKYQYLLEGYDKQWSPLSTTSTAGFGNMHEGKYNFRVKAVNPYGVWSETSYQFTVRPPWYRTWWAYLSYFLLALAVGRIFILWRERNLRKENIILESKVEERTDELQKTVEHLKITQAQLIQSEKMASLGELTAGIAHEIQNPLNFVNNFAEVNKELMQELKEEKDPDTQGDIIKDLDDNLGKIIHHGKRAESIVKGMLQHSRAGTGKKSMTDINNLADEYLRLSYQGFRNKDKAFNAALDTSFDPALGLIETVSEDVGRVLLNIFNNAFFALAEKQKKDTTFKPAMSVITRKLSGKAEIVIRDNGDGIPKNITDKIFQPFFTTKPTGQGTGLGLSISYDIIKAHGGELQVISKEHEFTEFTILLPATANERSA